MKLSDVDEKLIEIRRILARSRTLLILDNLESVIDQSVFEFIETIPFPSQLIGTSRRVHSDLVSVSHVELPAISDKSCGQLLQRELTMRPGRASIAVLREQEPELVDRLESMTLGNPLAIKWAAAQLRAVPIDSLVTSMEAGRGDLLRNMFEETWRRLSFDSQRSLETITYFKTPPTVETALSVAKATPIADRVLTELSTANLLELSSGATRADDARIALHPLTHAFAVAKLSEVSADSRRVLRASYIDYYVESLQSIGGRDWDNPKPFQTIDSERDNYLQAAAIAAEDERWTSVMAIADGLRNYLLIYGYWGLRLELCQLALRAAEALDDNRARAQFYRHIGWTQVLQGGLEDASTNLHTARQLAVYCEDLKVEADAIGDLAEISRLRSDLKAARALRTESLRLSRVGGTKRDIYVEQTLLAQMDLDERRLDAAQEGFMTSLHLAEELRWHRAIAYCLHWLADVARLQGDYGEARSYLAKSREYLAPFHDRARLALILKTEALLVAQQGDGDRARTIAHEAMAELKKLGLPYELVELRPLVDASDV
jgi:tetratricopeptide (TPR) repeat protein